MMAEFNIFLFLEKLIGFLMVLLIIRIVMSWVMPYPNTSNPLIRILLNITDPVMAPFRAIIPPLGGIDLSPMLLFFLLGLLQKTFRSLAYNTAF